LWELFLHYDILFNWDGVVEPPRLF
jgi:hypothetical protein